MRDTSESGKLRDADDVADYLAEIGNEGGDEFANDPAEFPLRYCLELHGFDSSAMVASTYRMRHVLYSADELYIVRCREKSTLDETMNGGPDSWDPVSWDGFEPPTLIKSFRAAEVYYCRKLR